MVRAKVIMSKVSKPIKPDNDDCCGGGCCPCVWDTYFNQLDLWEEQEAKEKIAVATSLLTKNQRNK